MRTAFCRATAPPTGEINTGINKSIYSILFYYILFYSIMLYSMKLRRKLL